MKKTIAAIALSLPVAACVTPNDQDRISLTKFRVNPDKTFTYTDAAIVEPGQTLETTPPLFERWLRDWLTENNMCQNGYKIIQTTGARTGAMTIWGGSWYTAEFTGRCV